MPKITVYIAASLDGYIATRDGGVEWLSEYEGGNEDYGYHRYYNSVDALIMGRKTYEQVLDFGQWPYPGKLTYVFTRNSRRNTSEVSFVSGSPLTLARDLDRRGVRHAWLVGGSQLVEIFLKKNCVDGFIITTIPKLLGKGIPLFSDGVPRLKLRTVKAKRYPAGLVQAHYDIVR